MTLLCISLIAYVGAVGFLLFSTYKEKRSIPVALERLFLYWKLEPDYSRVIREPEFIDKIYFWGNEPCIDTTYFAISIKQKCFLDLKNEKEALGGFIKGHFASYKNVRGFRQCRSIPYPSMHATHCAIGLVKGLHSIKNDEPIGYDRAKKLFEAISEDFPEDIFKFTAECFDIKSGGFRELPHADSVPSINETASALWMLWNLGMLDRIAEKKELIKDFILSMSDRFPSFRTQGPFRNKTGEQPFLCSTYYAMRALDDLMDESQKASYVVNNGAALLYFIKQSRRLDGGFAANSEHESSIVHTKNALSLLSRWLKKYSAPSYWDEKYYDSRVFYREPGYDKYLFEAKQLNDDTNKYLAEVQDGLIKYLKRVELSGVYCFGSKTRFQPNLYATNLALDIINSLPRHSIDISRADIESLVDKCRDGQGGYWGYPIHNELMDHEYKIVAPALLNIITKKEGHLTHTV